MIIRPAASRIAKAGPASYFTGAVFIDELAAADAASRVNANAVTFAPGARTAWHTHDFRQVLVVTAGTGILQIQGEPARRLQQGDVALVPPHFVHWHGATDGALLTHLSLLESDTQGTVWMAPVAEDDYREANRRLPALA